MSAAPAGRSSPWLVGSVSALAASARRFRFLQLGAGAVAMLLLRTPSGAQQAADQRANGWTFSYTTTTIANGRPMTAGDLALDVAIWRGHVRVLVRSGSLRAITGDSGTILFSARDSVLDIINPTRHEILRVNRGDVGAVVGAAPGAAQLDVTDVMFAVRDLGAGPALMGTATRRLETRQSYALRITAGSMNRTARTEQRTVAATSQTIARRDDGFAAFGSMLVMPLRQPAAVHRALELKRPKSAPVFVFSDTTIARVISGTDTLRTEVRGVVTALRAAVLDTATFRAPSGYRVTELSRLLQQRQKPAGVQPKP
jgi:hypothetical protein